MATTTTSRLDTFGAALSGLCALHCLLAPTVVALMPAAMGIGDERVEMVLLASAVVLAFTAAFMGWRRHRRNAPLVLFALAAVIIGLGRMVGEGHVMGHVLVIGGALGLAMAHLHNYRCAKCMGAPGRTCNSGIEKYRVGPGRERERARKSTATTLGIDGRRCISDGCVSRRSWS